jgi:hypothetical protein
MRVVTLEIEIQDPDTGFAQELDRFELAAGRCVDPETRAGASHVEPADTESRGGG